MGIANELASLKEWQSREKKEEGRAISSAQQENERQSSIRKQVREERVRRAQVVSAAEASGVAGSSVETSTIGSGQTLVAQGTAFSEGATLTNRSLSFLSQETADLDASAAAIRASSGRTAQRFNSLVGMGLSIYSVGAA